MNNYALFTDASVNPKFKIGVGGYLIINDSFPQIPNSGDT